MRNFSLLFLMVVSLFNLRAEACTYKEISLTKRVGKMGIYKVTQNVELRIDEGQDNQNYFDGPISIFINGKQKCQISGGGIYSGFYLSNSNSHILTAEYSGSEGTNRVFEIETCKFDSVNAQYGGDAKLENGSRLVNPPYCEPLNFAQKLSGCSTAHVYSFSNDCKLKFDELASRALTKKTIGIELPLKGSHNVLGTGTPQAKIVP
jgi:hypothetical protein